LTLADALAAALFPYTTLFRSIKIRMGGGKEMDFRVSVCPTLFGEKIVLRLLDKSNLQLDMTKLGFDPTPLAWFKEAIDRPYGMVDRKSTRLNSSHVKISYAVF